ncbi:permease [Gracilibacillus sp. S3-1-1]|uniref:Permease n=1 Tax=Gracilibacillus pellucidus TaxID=3095368 RepID=A0ACC6M0Z9_9BACI|nr:permease [Gracilibacillus sp. S3-1-1]MDX8044619.1 permease [Gracilibacillus sp. S3-1-1]
MFAGHFGVAAAVKSKAPKLPLWSLLVSTQLLDIFYILFDLAGLEYMEPIGEGGYASMMIYAFYTHSLVGALILSLLFGFISFKLWDKKSGVIIGAVIFSHWVLDLIVHRPDIAILPGNVGDFPLLGLGLWQSVPASILVEFLLITIGSILYFQYAIKSSGPKHKVKGIVAGCVMTVFLFLSLGIDVFL